MEANVQWTVDPAEPALPTPRELRLFELLGGYSPDEGRAANVDRSMTPILFKWQRPAPLTAVAPSDLTVPDVAACAALLDGPKDTPRWSLADAEPCARPSAPRAPAHSPDAASPAEGLLALPA